MGGLSTEPFNCSHAVTRKEFLKQKMYCIASYERGSNLVITLADIVHNESKHHDSFKFQTELSNSHLKIYH